MKKTTVLLAGMVAALVLIYILEAWVHAVRLRAGQTFEFLRASVWLIYLADLVLAGIMATLFWFAAQHGGRVVAITFLIVGLFVLLYVPVRWTVSLPFQWPSIFPVTGPIASSGRRLSLAGAFLACAGLLLLIDGITRPQSD